jgi:hypothetical protein
VVSAMALMSTIKLATMAMKMQKTPSALIPHKHLQASRVNCLTLLIRLQSTTHQGRLSCLTFYRPQNKKITSIWQYSFQRMSLKTFFALQAAAGEILCHFFFLSAKYLGIALNNLC